MMHCWAREFYIMHQEIICLGSMLNDAMWGQGVLYIMHQEMECLGSMLNDTLWGQGVLYYTSGNDMFRKYAK